MSLHSDLYAAARESADATAAVDLRSTRTFGELAARARAVAAGLARLGALRGDRVAVVAKNRVEVLELAFAASEVGAILVPLSSRSTPVELGELIEHSGARWVAAESAFVAPLQAARVDLPHVEGWIALDPAPADWTRFEDLARGVQGPQSPDADEREPSLLVYTSGTTGRPKGALLSHHNLASVARSAVPTLDLRGESDALLLAAPLHHVAGLVMLACCVRSRTLLVLLPEFSPGPVVDALARHRCTHTFLVPAMMQWLLRELPSLGAGIPRLRRVGYGAAPASWDLLARFREAFGCELLQGYGMTETAGVLTLLQASEHDFARAWRAGELAPAGRAIDACELRVVDDSGAPVGSGAVGEIVARGENLFLGYWRDAAADREAIRDGWFRTGDLGQFDERGLLHVVDRLKDLILVGGEKVVPREVEDVLCAAPGVAEAAVIGAPHAIWGEEVVACVVPRAGASPDARALIQHCRARLARHKCPTRVDFRRELPRNAAGKVSKRSLRDEWARAAGAR